MFIFCSMFDDQDMNLSPCSDIENIKENSLRRYAIHNEKWTDFQSKLRTNRVTTIYAARAIIIQEYLEANGRLCGKGMQSGDENSTTSLDLYALNKKSLNSGFPQNISALNISTIDFESLNQSVKVSDIAQDSNVGIESKPEARQFHRVAFDEYVNSIIGRTKQKSLPKEKASLRRSLSFLFCYEDITASTSKELPKKLEGNKILKRSRSLFFNYADDEIFVLSDHREKNEHYLRQDIKEKEEKSVLGNHQCRSSSMSNCLNNDFDSSNYSFAQNNSFHKSHSASRFPVVTSPQDPRISTSFFLQDTSIGSTKHNQNVMSFEGSCPGLHNNFGEQNFQASSLKQSTRNDLSQAALSLKTCIDVIRAKQVMKEQNSKSAKQEKLLVDFPIRLRARGELDCV